MKTSNKNVIFALYFTIIGIAFGLCSNVSAGEYVYVSSDLELYYEEAGTGTPIIFVPGWISTTYDFKAQIAHFSQNYRAITYDPRGQGRSSKTLSGNDHMQHGADLKAFMDTLDLKDVILVGHSSGCYDSYAYFRAYGPQNIKAFVCIDTSPKEVMAYEGDWAFTKSPLDYRPLYDGLSHDRENTIRDFVTSEVTRSMTEEEINNFVDEWMKTPLYVAKQLLLEWFILDWTEEIKFIDGKIPVLNVLSNKENWTEPAIVWLAENAPNSEIAVFGLHMMFWEFPNRFNAIVDGFLEKGSFFDSNGVQIHYKDQGQGEPVVLIHGGFQDLTFWDTLGAVDALTAAGYRVITLDLRGYGRSDKPHDPAKYGLHVSADISRLLDHLRISKAHVLGFSLGAIIANDLRSTQPDRLLTMTMVGSGAFNSESVFVVHAAEFAEGIARGTVETIRRKLIPPGQPQPTRAQIDKVDREIGAVNDMQAMAAIQRALGRVEPVENLRANKVPSRVVIGELDANKKDVDRMAAEMANLEVITIPGADHMETIFDPGLHDNFLNFLGKYRVAQVND